MGITPSKRALLWESLALRLSIAAGSCALLVAWRLRRVAYFPDPSLLAQLQLTSGILAFAFAGIALVRFRGTNDRLPLIFACGFLILGFALASSSLVFIHPATARYDASLRDPMAWVISRTLLAVLLLAGLVVAQRFPTSRNPSVEITWAMLVVVVLTSALSATHWQLPAIFVVHPGGAIPRPGNLFPAGLFLLAAIGYHSRFQQNRAPFERSLFISSVLHISSCLAASQSDHVFDAPFAFAELLQSCGYAVLLGGAIFDNAKLFDNIRELAVSDSLTGLVNHRRLVDVLGIEIERSKRTGKPFALILFDMDGLKTINDHHGHLVGTRAICRVAEALRFCSRAIDTAARQGGDEFALVLPETGAKGAQEVSSRVSHQVSEDQETPPISISPGVAVYPQDGQTIEALLGAADRDLYIAKAHNREATQLTKAEAV
jgi:diguanylate cyclase (GGDEF)-like protein